MEIPSFEISDIPASKDPKWNEMNERWKAAENIRMHLYKMLDQVNDISETEKERWEKVIKALYELEVHTYKEHGFTVHVH